MSFPMRRSFFPRRVSRTSHRVARGGCYATDHYKYTHHHMNMNITMSSEEVETVETPSVAADDAKAKFEVMRLLAELEAMDQEKARLEAMLELDQLRSMRTTMLESFSKLEAMAHTTADSAEVMPGATPESSQPLAEAVPGSKHPAHAPSPEHAHYVPTTKRPPRKSALSAAQESRLAQLLTEDGDGEAAARESLHRAQTSTLQMLMGAKGKAEPVEVAEVLPDLAADALAAARSDFAPDQTTLTDSIARMEEALRAVSLQRDNPAA